MHKSACLFVQLVIRLGYHTLEVSFWVMMMHLISSPYMTLTSTNNTVLNPFVIQHIQRKILMSIVFFWPPLRLIFYDVESSHIIIYDTTPISFMWYMVYYIVQESKHLSLKKHWLLLWYLYFKISCLWMVHSILTSVTLNKTCLYISTNHLPLQGCVSLCHLLTYQKWESIT